MLSPEENVKLLIDSGMRRIILHASEMGEPLYRSMGFDAGAAGYLYSARETHWSQR